jgi:Notch-like protein
MHVWMYAVPEFEDAIDDCSSCTSECNEFSLNSGSVHAWDEGVAFYTGSLEGSNEGGDSGGKLVYRLAEKRCANFGTCGYLGGETSGTSQVNYALFPLFAEGARLLERGECGLVRPIVDKIVSLMTVPLVQGSLRYAFKIGMVESERSQKNAAEGAVFAASSGVPSLLTRAPTWTQVMPRHAYVSSNASFTCAKSGKVPASYRPNFWLLLITLADAGLQ